jgi:sugar/nucleoside kinase (ribokinase family)
LAIVGTDARIVTRAAEREMPLLMPLLERTRAPVTILETPVTTRFRLTYTGEERSTEVLATADPWRLEDLRAAAVDTTWIHVASLLRGDFPAGLLRHLAAEGHVVSFDGQGLVRRRSRGPLRLDDAYERDTLEALRVLKLAEEEAQVFAGTPPDPERLLRLGVPEVVVTFGGRGCDVYVDGRREHVAAKRVGAVHPTGAGDIFMVAYVYERAAHARPLESAQRAAEVVARALEERRRHSVATAQSELPGA